MKKLLYTLILSVAASCTHRTAVEADYNVVPLPCSMLTSSGGDFRLTPSTCLVIADSTQFVNAELFAGYIETLTGFRPAIIGKAPSKGYIRLTASNCNATHEGYRITVSADSIVVDGADAAGTFYGLQTLRKAIRGGKGEDVLYPAVMIEDAPRFAYRGAHLDCARHFFPVDSVKLYIDMLALHNINHFHWHLTDDQGWRMEIKSRPRLAEIGSVRSGTIIGTSEKYDSIPYGGCFTQTEMRDIVAYAADRHITVIPEIDLPGHMAAALASYPSLGCTGGPYEVMCRWGVSDDILCAGNEDVYVFLDEVLDEVTDICPSEHVHIGGDEVPHGKWEKCSACQSKIHVLGLKDDAYSTAEQKLQNHIMKYAADRLAAKGRRVIGWDEIIDNGFDTTAVVMSWRGPQDGGQDGATHGYRVIKVPNTHLYFDYQYAEGDTIGAPYWRKIPLDSVYAYRPVPEYFTPAQAANVIGVQGNVWTEFIPSFREVQYMALPRMAALAELQWCDAPKDFDAFIGRLRCLLPLYEAEGYCYRPLENK